MIPVYQSTMTSSMVQEGLVHGEDKSGAYTAIPVSARKEFLVYLVADFQQSFSSAFLSHYL